MLKFCFLAKAEESYFYQVSEESHAEPCPSLALVPDSHCSLVSLSLCSGDTFSKKTFPATSLKTHTHTPLGSISLSPLQLDFFSWNLGSCIAISPHYTLCEFRNLTSLCSPTYLWCLRVWSKNMGRYGFPCWNPYLPAVWSWVSYSPLWAQPASPMKQKSEGGSSPPCTHIIVDAEI